MISGKVDARSPRLRTDSGLQYLRYDLKRVCANLHCSEQVLRQLNTNENPIRIDLPGPKSNKNDSEGEFYTYIGADAIAGLKEYFDKMRGWPKPGEPLWTYSMGRT
jgi:hypothetical protein